MPSKHKPGWYSSPISCADVGLFTVREGIVAEGVRGDSKGRGFDERIGCAFGSATGGEGGEGAGLDVDAADSCSASTVSTSSACARARRSFSCS